MRHMACGGMKDAMVAMVCAPFTTCLALCLFPSTCYRTQAEEEGADIKCNDSGSHSSDPVQYKVVMCMYSPWGSVLWRKVQSTVMTVSGLPVTVIVTVIIVTNTNCKFSLILCMVTHTPKITCDQCHFILSRPALNTMTHDTMTSD